MTGPREVTPNPLEDVACPRCEQRTVRVEERLEPVRNALVPLEQPYRVLARWWPWAVCDNCGRSEREDEVPAP